MVVRAILPTKDFRWMITPTSSIPALLWVTFWAALRVRNGKNNTNKKVALAAVSIPRAVSTGTGWCGVGSMQSLIAMVIIVHCTWGAAIIGVILTKSNDNFQIRQLRTIMSTVCLGYLFLVEESTVLHACISGWHLYFEVMARQVRGKFPCKFHEEWCW